MIVRFDDYKDIVLEDDLDVPFGGTSFIGETLEDFLFEEFLEEVPEYIDLEKVNTDLKACGILPIGKEACS